MHRLRDLVFGTGRAVSVLSFTEILAWGILIYPPVLIMPHLAADHGWSLAFGMAGFSIGLVTSGMLSPTIGHLIDRNGGNIVMSVGALAGALGLVLLTLADQRPAYLACWLLIGAAMSSTLYDPAFATLTRIFGSSARRQITFVTFAGGFASTVGWPATHFLLERLDWRGTYLVYAALLALISAPLHALALPRTHAHSAPAVSADGQPPAKVLPAKGPAFLLVAAAFTAYAFVPSGLAAHLLAIFTRAGIDAGTVVWIGALFGPAQVAARLIEFSFGRNTHPLWVARFAFSFLLCGFAMLAFAGFSVA